MHKPVKQLNLFVTKLNVDFIEVKQGLLFVAWELFGLALNISETAESVKTELIWCRSGCEDDVVAKDFNGGRFLGNNCIVS